MRKRANKSVKARTGMLNERCLVNKLVQRKKIILHLYLHQMTQSPTKLYFLDILDLSAYHMDLKHLQNIVILLL